MFCFVSEYNKNKRIKFCFDFFLLFFFSKCKRKINLLSTFHLFGDIGVTGISDGEGGGTEVLTAGGAEVQVGAVVVVDGGLGEHAVVLELGLADGVAVVGDNDDLSAASTEGSHGLVEAEAVLAGLHDEGDLRVEVIYLRLGLLSHFVVLVSKL